MRRPVTAALAALLTCALLAACGGDPKPIFVSTSPSPSSPTTTTTTAASGPPVMPDAAKAHTKAGAIAFARYYFVVANYAQAELDPTALASLGKSSCDVCAVGPRSISHVRSAGGHIRGGLLTFSGATATALPVPGRQLVAVAGTLTASAETINYPGTGRDQHIEAKSGRTRLTLEATPEGWVVSTLEVQ